MKRTWLFLLFLVLAHGAGAAEISVVTTKGGGKLILLAGEIQEEDGQRFAAAASGIDKAVVAFSSPGGHLISGLRIGQYIRLHNFGTLVPDDSSCASACALAWLGGTKRMMQPRARIGFHAAYYRDRTGAVHVTGSGNALVGAYLSRLGLEDETILYIEKAAPHEMTWMREDDARRLRIDVVTIPSSEPEPEPPARAGIIVPGPGTELGTLAIGFVDAYFAHWSETNDDALEFFRTAYFQRVDFYGQSIPVAVVMEQKANFAGRWPERIYAVRAGSTKARCARQSCDVTGIVDWDARNSETRKRSAGSAAFQLKVVFQGSRPMIVAETGQVLSREPDGFPAANKE